MDSPPSGHDCKLVDKLQEEPNSTMNNKGGYECDFVDKPPESMQSECPVCLLVLREPYQVNCCGQAFCQVCLENIQSNSKPCPCCNAERFDYFEDKRLKRSLSTFKLHCSKSQQGCQWVGELGQLNNHIANDCPLTIIDCDFQHVGCKVRLPRKEMPGHLRECVVNHISLQAKSFSQIVDSLDKEKKEMQEHVSTLQGSSKRASELRETVDRLEKEKKEMQDNVSSLQNSNKQFCQELLELRDTVGRLDREKKEVEENVSTLQESNKQVCRDVSDLIETVGRLDKEKKELERNYFIIQKSIEQSRQDILHLRQKNTQLEQQVSDLNLAINQYIVRIPICPCEFTIDNFQQRRQVKEDWKSPPFYSHARGYKMCLEVCTNYWIMFSGSTYVTVFIYLMKGDFDNELSWPFSGKVHVTLVSQDTGSDHKHTINFTDNDARRANLRVTNGERSAYRHGKYDFISHERLLPSYIANDSIKFRITTDGT